MVRKEIFAEEDARFFGRVKYLQTTSGEGHLSFGITIEITKLLASPKKPIIQFEFFNSSHGNSIGKCHVGHVTFLPFYKSNNDGSWFECPCF